MNVKDIAVCVSIPQAAKMLKVTEKTVRNYIDRRLLGAEKWNGSWRIQRGDLIEIYYKKYGIILEQPDDREEGRFVRIPLGEYDRLQRQAGRLEVAEGQVEALRADSELLKSKVTELESSSASGWTEVRTLREERKALETKLERSERQERETSVQLLSCKERLEETREARGECLEEIERLKRETAELEERLEARKKRRRRRKEMVGAPRRRREPNRLRRLLQAIFSPN